MRNGDRMYVLLHLVLFLGLWTTTAWLLLSTFQWSSTLYSALAAIGAGYLAGGALAVVPALLDRVKNLVATRRENHGGMVVRTHPVRVFIPAEVLRLHQRG